MNYITTEQRSVLHRLIDEKDAYITLSEFVLDRAGTIERLLTGAFTASKIDEFTFRRLMGEVRDCWTWEDAFDHYRGLLEQFVQGCRDHLLHRIINGAEYIESIGQEHPHYQAAARKYNTLCEELAQ